MNSDFKDLLQIFVEEEIRFLVVGGYAVIHHAQPRYTKDLDLWIELPDRDSLPLAAITGTRHPTHPPARENGRSAHPGC